MFGEANIGDAGHEGHSSAAAMADSDEVCGCNGVTKGTICKAIKDKGLFTLDEVRKHTKASGGCGSCTGLVEQLLMVTAGGDYSAAPTKKAMCGCTDHSHQSVRDAIREEHLLTHRRRLPRARLAHAQRLRQLPPGDQLLPDQHLAEGGQGRPAEPLHQRAQPRQHPEGRHLQRDPAHVGRRDHGRRTAPHRRRRSTSTRSRPSRSPAASASTCWASRRKTCPRSGRTSACPAATPTPRRCAP